MQFPLTSSSHFYVISGATKSANMYVQCSYVSTFDMLLHFQEYSSCPVLFFVFPVTTVILLYEYVRHSPFYCYCCMLLLLLLTPPAPLLLLLLCCCCNASRAPSYQAGVSLPLPSGPTVAPAPMVSSRMARGTKRRSRRSKNSYFDCSLIVYLVRPVLAVVLLL